MSLIKILKMFRSGLKRYSLKLPSVLSGLVLLIIITGSCSEKDDSSPNTNKARLCINLNVEMKINESSIAMKSTLDTRNFKVLLYKASGEFIMNYEKASDLPSEIELEPGEYYVIAHSDNFAVAAFDNPYYVGKTDTIFLKPNDFKTVEVTCSLANCAVTITYSDNIKQSFSDYYTEVSIGTDKLVFDKAETRLGYFDIQAMNVKSFLMYTLPNGSQYSKELSGKISNPGSGKLYEVVLDAGITEGYTAINILLDETVEKQTLKINDTESDEIQYGDLLISEIMYDPVSLSDADGEWFEVYNNSTKNINMLNLVIKTSSSSHIITSEINLAPGEYYLFAKKDEAVNGPKYIYGSAINLTNTGGSISISTYGSDGTDGFEIAAITYDNGSSFPKASGASLNLSPALYDVDLAKSGSSWCLSTSVYNTGDFGTPGLPNDECE